MMITGQVEIIDGHEQIHSQKEIPGEILIYPIFSDDHPLLLPAVPTGSVLSAQKQRHASGNKEIISHNRVFWEDKKQNCRRFDILA